MKNLFKKILSLLVIPLLSFAQAPININIPNPLGNRVTDIMTLLDQIIRNIVMPVGAVILVVYIIYAGFRFISAQGKPKEIQEAQQMLLWGLIGGAVLLGATAISAVIRTTVNNIVGP